MEKENNKNTRYRKQTKKLNVERVRNKEMDINKKALIILDIDNLDYY